MKNDTKDAPNPSPLPWVEELTSYLEPTGFILTGESVIGPFEEETRSLIISSVNSIPRLLAANAELREAAKEILKDKELRHYLTDGSKTISVRVDLLRLLDAALAKSEELAKGDK